MKKRQIIRLVAVVAFSAFALAACNKGANTNNSTNSNNSNNTANSTSNKGTSTPAPAGDYSSPTAAFKTFYEAAKANNIEGIKRSMSKKALADLATSSAKENKTVDAALGEVVKDAPASMPEMRNEKIEGDKATAEMKDDKMDKWSKVYFVKEDGQWKISFDEEKAAGMEGMDHGNMDKK